MMKNVIFHIAHDYILIPSEEIDYELLRQSGYVILHRP